MRSLQLLICCNRDCEANIEQPISQAATYNMELHAYTRTISDLFSVKKKYIVPRFQREYSWNKEKISELWDDIISNISLCDDNIIEHEKYFIGSLVLVGNDKSIEMQIVDGQQRLTTLTILLSALCQRFIEIEKKNIAESIYENYIAGKDDDGKYYFKLENETPKPFFQTKIQDIDKQSSSPSSEEEKTLLASYKEFYNFTSKESIRKIFNRKNNNLYENLLKAIRDQVVKYLKVIFITVGDEDEAYTIFETLNARGMDLSFVDLIKNKVFKSFNTTHPDDFAKTKWNKLRNSITSRDGIGSTTLETYVRHWWIAKYNYTSADNVYKYFKNLWNTKQIDAEEFLDELVNDVDIYIKIISPITEDFKQQEEKSIYRSLVALKIFKVAQQKPFLFSLFKAKDTNKIKLSKIKSIITFIENFHFSFNAICSMRPSGIEKSYSKAAIEIFKAKNKQEVNIVVDKLKEKLEMKLPDKELFVKNFSKLKYTKKNTKDKKLIQYVFSCLESRKQTTNEFSPDSLTLEHILSQSSSQDDCIGTIGNLLPLGSQLNEEAGNKRFQKKLEVYKKSNFQLTKEFAEQEYNVWNQAKIEQRTNKLAEDYYDYMWNN